MNKLQFHENKVLKLTNVLKYKVQSLDENFDLNIAIEQMQSYIKTKATMQIGPLIQYTKTSLNDNNQMDIEIILMLQCNQVIHKVEAPYSMEPLIRVPSAMYCRYIGPEEKIKFAYDKIHIEAFENDILLEDKSYTIFVDNNVEEEQIIADVFIPKVNS